MKITFDKRFEKDYDKLPKDIQGKVKDIIKETLEANNLSELKSIKKLSGFKGYYRFKIRNYRLGLLLENDGILVFSRVLHRKDIYRFFPKG